MEIIAVFVMLFAGVAVAVVALVAVSLSGGKAEAAQHAGTRPPEREGVAVSLLYHVLAAGGLAKDEALRQIRRTAGLSGALVEGIDVGSWAESFARVSTPQQRAALLESAVRLVAAPGARVPLRQYAALLDLSFGLGFQTDALARLRTLYPFEYVDHAKDARPREADRRGGAATLFVRDRRTDGDLLRLLGVAAEASNQEIGAAYRKLAARHHPDRFHGASPEEESEAASRFIEITSAYEELMARRRS